jgi:hypothetical protein
MNIDWFRSRKFASISLIISIIEILIIWGGTTVALSTPHLDWKWFRPVMIYVYGFGFIGSLIFSIVGLANDLRRVLAFCALAVAVIDLAICSVPIAY